MKLNCYKSCKLNLQLLKSYIAKNNMSIRELSNKSGIDSATISKDLRGEHSFTLRVLLKIISVLQIPKYKLQNLFIIEK